MKLFRVNMPVTATVSIYIRAKDESAAIERANEEFSQQHIPLCFQCSRMLGDDPAIYETDSSYGAYEVDEEVEADEIEGFNEEWGIEDGQ